MSLPDGIERVGEFCFENTAVESVDLSNTSLTELYRATFVSSESLKSVILPSSLKKLSEGNFDGCTALTSVTCNAQEPPVAEEDSFTDAVREIYDLSGHKTANASKGMNIFKIKSGETRKGLIRN